MSFLSRRHPLVTDSQISIVSSDISHGKFPEIYSNLSVNVRKFVNYLCQSVVSKSSVAN